MRGTLHFVAATDLRWMLQLRTRDRGESRRLQELELDDATLARCRRVLESELADGARTRAELMDALGAAGIATGGQRGYHVLGWAAETGAICFAPPRGKQQTFVLLDSWVPTTPPVARDEALALLATRYVTGHGPVTPQDFGAWSGLPAADVRAALHLAGAQLEQVGIAGRDYWLARVAATAPASRRVLLLPAFDEFFIGYRDRAAMLDPEHASRIAPGKNGVLRPTMLVDGRFVGTWSRSRSRAGIEVRAEPFTTFGAPATRSFAVAARRYARFVGEPFAGGSDADSSRA